MANIKQQQKRILTDQKHKLRNQMFKSKLRTNLKKTQQAILDQNKNAISLTRLTIKLLDQAKSKKIKKSNFVNRHKSQLMKNLVKMVKPN